MLSGRLLGKKQSWISPFSICRQRFLCEHDAKKTFKDINKKLKYHLVEASSLTENKVYEGKGRPPKGVESKSIEWQITGKYEENPEAIKHARDQKSCFILAINISGSALSPEEILKHYKAQSAVERGFRFLKDPLFFISSLFIKKPSTIDALLMIMTLSLLVYSIAQRRMRVTMKK